MEVHQMGCKHLKLPLICKGVVTSHFHPIWRLKIGTASGNLRLRFLFYPVPVVQRWRPATRPECRNFCSTLSSLLCLRQVQACAQRI